MSAEKYVPKKGDRVRVVLEALVGDTIGDGFIVGEGVASNYITIDAEHVVSIEGVEPPVEVFGPGDVVRMKGQPPCVYTVGRDGYLFHQNGLFYKDSDSFTSKEFERVELK